MRIYYLPLRLITRGHWRGLSYAGKAILPAIGIHADKNGRCFPGLRLIGELSGCRKHDTVQSGIHSLISRGLLHKERKGRSNWYYLKGHAILSTGSYYPMSEGFLINFWSKLKPGEKAVFAVLAVKAVIENREGPDFPEGFSEDEDWFGAGEIQREKWIKLAGVSRMTWFRAIDGLVNKEIILVRGENRYVIHK